MTRLITPAGGTLTYTYADATRRAGALTMTTRVVATRVTGGYEIAPGTWTYSYGTGANQDTTVVACPCRTERYRFYGRLYCCGCGRHRHPSASWLSIR